ncbi:AFG1-like ATPase-domain-containing protein [Pelagophyceae sp. CCMP2097]|nr:AFG1-like ATPase-domain-containing protein [Pelagophyceae sp. CCMP2097]
MWSARGLARRLGGAAARAGPARRCSDAARAPSASYAALVASGAVQVDEAQVRVLAALDRLHSVLHGYTIDDARGDAPPAAAPGEGPPPTPAPAPDAGAARPNPLLATPRYRPYTSRHAGASTEAPAPAAEAPAPVEATTLAAAPTLAAVPAPAAEDVPAAPAKRQPRGLYIWGDVGTGKSMCMDIFFGGAGVSKRRRVHFHEFMLEVHRRVHAFKQRGGSTSERDAIGAVGRDIAAEAALLCFDEMQVTDVADAMIIRRLFDSLFRAGVVVVATSNRPPNDLYERGANRKYFEPFVDQLAAHCKVVQVASDRDHRVANAVAMGSPGARYVVDGRGADALFPDAEAALAQHTGPGAVPGWAPRALETGDGRTLRCLGTRGVAAVFAFDELCDSDVGAADYAALAHHFGAVAVVGVPKLDLRRHDVARRFITLVDELYEHKVAAFFFAEAAPAELFPSSAVFDGSLAREKPNGVDRPGGPVAQAYFDPAARAGAAEIDTTFELASVRELAWAFRRAASRLSEMASPRWPRAADQAADPD